MRQLNFVGRIMTIGSRVLLTGIDTGTLSQRHLACTLLYRLSLGIPSRSPQRFPSLAFWEFKFRFSYILGEKKDIRLGIFHCHSYDWMALNVAIWWTIWITSHPPHEQSKHFDFFQCSNQGSEMIIKTIVVGSQIVTIAIRLLQNAQIVECEFVL